MTLSWWETTFVVVFLILANGFFAAAEIAIVAARRGKLQQQAEAGDRAARTALLLANNPGIFLPTVQLGLTFAGALASALAGAVLVNDLAELLQKPPLSMSVGNAHTAGLGVVVTFLTILEVLLGELVPKRVALNNPAGLARIVALPMYWMAIVGKPLVWIVDGACHLVLRAFGVKDIQTPRLHREDIEHLLDEGVSGGVLDPVERQVAYEALRLGDRSVRDIMQPRIEIDGIDLDTPPKEVLGVISMAGFSRLPVYEGDLDHIVGFVHVKDVLRQVHLGWTLDLRKLWRPALFVPESLPLDKLLKRFREARTHMAVVLDEFGGTEGIVSLDQVLEELIGEMHDEHSRDQREEFVRRDDGSWLVDGIVNLDDMIDRIAAKQVKLPSPRSYSTLAGLIHDLLGRLPHVGEKIEWQGLTLEVVDMDGPRIDRVLITAPAGEGESASAE